MTCLDGDKRLIIELLGVILTKGKLGQWCPQLALHSSPSWSEARTIRDDPVYRLLLGEEGSMQDMRDDPS